MAKWTPPFEIVETLFNLRFQITSILSAAGINPNHESKVTCPQPGELIICTLDTTSTYDQQKLVLKLLYLMHHLPETLIGRKLSIWSKTEPGSCSECINECREEYGNGSRQWVIILANSTAVRVDSLVNPHNIVEIDLDDIKV